MTTSADYGDLFRQAYAVLHGGRTGEVADSGVRRPGEPLEEYLSRTRSEALARLRGELASVEPPPELGRAHEILKLLLAGALDAEAALAAQVEAYRCGQFQDSIAHSERLQALVAESARLDRELIAALKAAEEAVPGTLSHLGISLD